MNAKRLSEVRALLSRPEFQDWWQQLQAARGGLAASEHRYDELLAQTNLMEFRAELTQKNAIDTLYRAGESEDAAANMSFESSELENRSFRVLADFEEQRFKVSELWYRLGAAERELEEKREAQRAAKSKKTDAELQSAERVFRTAKDSYDKETVRKNQLWEEVELIWERSAEVSLLVAERRVQGKKIRREAESLFALAEERKGRARELRQEAEAANSACESGRNDVRQLLARAQTLFACAAGDEFLYFRQKDNPKRAFGVSLIEDKETFNIEAHPLVVYVVDSQRGVAFLEPARTEAPSTDEGDRRFEAYFLHGRKGSDSAGSQS